MRHDKRRNHLQPFLLAACFCISACASRNPPPQPDSGSIPASGQPVAQATAEALPPSEQPTSVSIIQLIANPEKYNGKRVRIIGFVRIEFEGNAIYLHQDYEKLGIYSNALWLDVTDEIRKDREKYDGKYVIVVGTFDASNHGHMGLFSGTISDIKRFDFWAETSGWRMATREINVHK